MRDAAAAILALSLSRPARTRFSRARSSLDVRATSSAVRAVSRHSRSADMATMKRRPSWATSHTAEPAQGHGTQFASGPVEAPSTAATSASRCSLVARMWPKPLSDNALTLSAEIRPRSATMVMAPIPKRAWRSSSTPGRVETSAVLPAKTWWAMGMPSPVTSSPITTWGRSPRWSRE